MAVFEALPWHHGEDLMHKKLHVPADLDNPSIPMLSQQAARALQQAPLLAIGTVDAKGLPWTSIWGGDPGFSVPLGQSIVGIRTPVAPRYDPVVEELVGIHADGGIVMEEGTGRMVSGLTIDLAARKRVKLYGRLVAGALSTLKSEDAGPGAGGSIGTEIQLIMKVEQSLGNCPKYINTKYITSAHSEPQVISDSPLLSSEAVSLIGRADMFFVSSRQQMNDMDTNHRGGPPGFVRITSTATTTCVFWPEYSGNRLYQTLGNLQVTPLAGLCFPDFATGDILYLTGTTEILAGMDAPSVLPRSNLVVKLTVTAARYVAKGLPFRGTSGEFSPYNPQVRYLSSEKEAPRADSEVQSNSAKLLSQTRLSPNISRFRFSLTNPASYNAGQYVTLDFSNYLGMGYSHMRDDDPLSINDDFVRTFTVSNPPGSSGKQSPDHKDDEFEITIRRVGPVTNFLFNHGADGSRQNSHLDVDVKGFGGSFAVEQADEETIGFIAGGVGITPLLPAMHVLDPDRLIVLWALRRSDLALATDVLQKHPNFAKSFRIFVTGPSHPRGDDNDTASDVASLEDTGADVVLRRLKADDVKTSDKDLIKKWFLCTSPPMRKDLLQWLGDKETIYEDFNF